MTQTSAAFTVTAPANRRAGQLRHRRGGACRGLQFSQDLQTDFLSAHPDASALLARHARAQVVDLKVASVKVGYMMGGGDEVPDAMRRMGVDVTMIDADCWRQETFRVRHHRRRRPRLGDPPGLRRQQRPAAQYMERGGTLIVQYQQGDYVERNLAPYPVWPRASRGSPTRPRR